MIYCPMMHPSNLDIAEIPCCNIERCTALCLLAFASLPDLCHAVVQTAFVLKEREMSKLCCVALLRAPVSLIWVDDNAAA
jgi:hypothetical protein